MTAPKYYFKAYLFFNKSKLGLGGTSVVECLPGMYKTLVLVFPNLQNHCGTENIGQLVECLPSLHRTLSLVPSTT